MYKKKHLVVQYVVDKMCTDYDNFEQIYTLWLNDID